MDFRHTEEEEIIRQEVRKFVKKEITPIAAEIDERNEFPIEIFRRIGEMGFFGAMFPEEYGGSGAGMIIHAIISEEIARGSAAVAGIFAVQVSLATSLIKKFGSEELKQKYLVPAIKGEKIGACGLTEPQAGSDAASIQTKAVKRGNLYVINGTKTFITNATVADFTTLVVVTDESKKKKGISVIIADKGTKGFSVENKLMKLGTHGADCAEIVFDDCEVPASNLVGKENEGWEYTVSSLEEGRITVAAISVGLAREAFENALSYAKKREQFGKPIGKFQGIQFMFADMATQIELARLITYEAAWKFDQGLPCVREVSMAKLFSSQMCDRVTTNALQIYGGYGYMMDYPLQRFFRDSRLWQIVEGTTQIQQMIIASTFGL